MALEVAQQLWSVQDAPGMRSLICLNHPCPEPAMQRGEPWSWRPIECVQSSPTKNSSLVISSLFFGGVWKKGSQKFPGWKLCEAQMSMQPGNDRALIYSTNPPCSLCGAVVPCVSTALLSILTPEFTFPLFFFKFWLVVVYGSAYFGS